MSNYTLKALIAATYTVDNSNDSSRSYDISAEANVSNGVVKSIQNGKVKEAGSVLSAPLAEFNDYSCLSCSIYDTTSGNRENIFNSISQFCTLLRSASGLAL